MRQYLDLLRNILDQGTDKTDRTGTGTRSIFGPQMRFNLQEGFPLVTTKKVHLKSIIHELLWLLKGDTNIKYLVDHGVNIWNEWPYQAYAKFAGALEEPDYDVHVDDVHQSITRIMTQEEFVASIKADPAFAQRFGDLGAVYGAQWRAWKTYVEHPDGTITAGKPIDQLAEVLRQLQGLADSRRILVSAWNVAELPQMALSPCHALYQFYTVPLNEYDRMVWAEKNNPALFETLRFIPKSGTPSIMDRHNVPKFRLDCQLYQRSADTMLGVPFNVASYALLTMMVAQVTNMVPGEFIWTGGDTHLYSNHLEQAKLQLTREPRPLPTMTLNPAVTDLFTFRYEDFTLTGYDPHPPIKAAVSV